MAKPLDPRAKAKRQKIVAGVLGLVLVGVLIFQAPTILGVFGGSSSQTASEPAPTPPPAAATPPPATPGATPPAAAAPGPAGSASLVDSDPAPPPADGQLVSFDRFESKDPFVPQVDAAPVGQSTDGSVPAGTGAKAESPQATAAKGSPSAAKPAEPKAEPTTKTATIAVNGTENEVAVGGTFPPDDPIFKLVSLKDGTARIGIVGGGYANGSPAISLNKGGKPVTLMNTADGTTYVLRYLR
jgi:hypothetical protein